MKDIISKINKAYENRIRLGVMSVLMVNDWVDFNTMKETLDVTDGNLASHINALEESGYLQIKKQFVGKKPQTLYRTTAAGRKSFTAHLDALEQIINHS